MFGTLLRDMLLKPGASVRAADAVRSLFEADLIVEIGDAAVNDATTPADVLAAIRGVRPFSSFRPWSRRSISSSTAR
ncbi:MAG: hypothetical protein HPM95_05375 [Alphaproteobacteria bacterium]|nr:hypothetical protein [Alphaproteobacteria bacterium]